MKGWANEGIPSSSILASFSPTRPFLLHSPVKLLLPPLDLTFNEWREALTSLLGRKGVKPHPLPLEASQSLGIFFHLDTCVPVKKGSESNVLYPGLLGARVGTYMIGEKDRTFEMEIKSFLQ